MFEFHREQSFGEVKRQTKENNLKDLWEGRYMKIKCYSIKFGYIDSSGVISWNMRV